MRLLYIFIRPRSSETPDEKCTNIGQLFTKRVFGYRYQYSIRLPDFQPCARFCSFLLPFASCLAREGPYSDRCNTVQYTMQ